MLSYQTRRLIMRKLVRQALLERLRVSHSSRCQESSSSKTRILRFVCSFVEHLIEISQHTLASRTSGMQISAVPFRKGANKPSFDPLRKHGLLPSSGSQLAPRDAGATYIVGGYVLDTTTKHDPSDRYIHEHMGREKEERRKRQIEGKQADKSLLEHLIGQETHLTTGAQALRMAREQLVAGKNNEGDTKGSAVKETTRKPAFSASALQRIGFDPTLKHGMGKKPKQDPERRVSIADLHGCDCWLTIDSSKRYQKPEDPVPCVWASHPKKLTRPTRNCLCIRARK